MAIVVGHSVSTSEKQRNFREIIKHLLQDFKNTQTEDIYPYFVYVDLNAGPGVHEKYGKGSPIIFLEEAQAQNIRYNMILFEQDNGVVEKLHWEILTHNQGYNDENITVLHNNNDIISERFLKSYLRTTQNRIIKGLVYSDPNSFDFGIASKFSSFEAFKNVDILLSGGCALIKRVNARKALKTWKNQEKVKLQEHINKIDRNYWFVKKLYSCVGAQWSLLLGTNHDKGDYSRLSTLYNVSYSEGYRILMELNYTKEELVNTYQMNGATHG